MNICRSWEYDARGDYHRNLDPNWSYAPTYFAKDRLVGGFVRGLPRTARILDAGCGEGVFVEKFRAEGFDVAGLDLNYGSDIVHQGSILKMPYDEGAFDVVLLLDVFEHLDFRDQLPALREISRVLKPGGQLVASIPNLAHLSSRVSMMLRGRLGRTDTEENHQGERPYHENAALLRAAGFSIADVRGITLTVPFVYDKLVARRAARFRWLHDLLEPAAVPSLAMLNVFFCNRG